jgi:hypothetical protein
MKFRKKPVVIEAEQLTDERALRCLSNNEEFAFGLRINGEWHPGSRVVYSASVTIDTLEGQMRANLNDWVIRGVKGELYPCKPDIFAATYEPAE